MRRLLLLVAFLVVLTTPSRGFAAQYPLGTIAATYPYIPSKLLADPLRNLVYVADTASGSVIVIDTTTLQAILTIPTGAGPVDMAIAHDDNTLYVANSSSTLAAISVVNLNTLTVTTSWSLPGTALAVAAGLGDRVYASATFSQDESAIYQLDGTTGEILTSFNQKSYDNDLLEITPDGKKLFVANTDSEPGSLKSFNVSKAKAVALQVNSDATYAVSQMVVSHNGQYLCLPSFGGNPGPSNHGTRLFSTANIRSSYGSFGDGNPPGPLAFSPDDSLVYQTLYGSSPVLVEFNLQNFEPQKEISLPTIGAQGYMDSVTSIVTDRTGSYLFIAELSSDGLSNVGQLTAMTTGNGTLTPNSVEPVITSSLTVTGTENLPFTYQITASGKPTTFDAIDLPPGMTVNPATGLISGTSTGSGDYELTIIASNASGSVTAYLDLSLVPYDSQPVFTITSLPAASIGTDYSFAVSAAGSPPGYTAFGLPAGLSQNATSGVITGVPTQTGVYSVVLGATNHYGSATETVMLTVNSPAPVIISSDTAGGKVGVAFKYSVIATNTPTAFTASGLPSGLTVNPTTGLISGVPTTLGAFAVVIGATNTYGIGTATLTLTIALPLPKITSDPFASGVIDTPFTFQVAAEGAPTLFAAKGLPQGLAIDNATGLISGQPEVAGKFAAQLSATNATGTGTATLGITIAERLPFVTLIDTVPAVTTGTGEVGKLTVKLSTALDYQLIVHYKIQGSAANGIDYDLLTGTVKVAAGKKTGPIRIIPRGDLGGAKEKVVKIRLEVSPEYRVVTTIPRVVTIRAGK